MYFLLRLRGEIRGQGRNSGFRERHSLIGVRRRCRKIGEITIYTNTQWGRGNTTLARTRAVRSRRRIRIISLDILPPSFRDETEDVGEFTYGYNLFLIIAPASGTSACPFCGGEVCIALCGPRLVSMQGPNICTDKESTPPFLNPSSPTTKSAYMFRSAASCPLLHAPRIGSAVLSRKIVVGRQVAIALLVLLGALYVRFERVERVHRHCKQATKRFPGVGTLIRCYATSCELR